MTQKQKTRTKYMKLSQKARRQLSCHKLMDDQAVEVALRNGTIEHSQFVTAQTITEVKAIFGPEVVAEMPIEPLHSEGYA